MFRSGIRIGRILGIEVRLDFSWLLIFLLVTISLGGDLFPAWHPDWPAPLAWIVATAASLLFFASILAHELSHSVVARAEGVPVRRITLFLFGGVASIEEEPPSPRSEFLITIAGPLCSFAISLLCALLASFSGASLRAGSGSVMEFLAALGPVATLLVWLTQVNLLVALFNLLPGFPLDGGRLLRAGLWAMTGDRVRATRWAAGAGRTLAWAFIACGAAMALGFRVPVLGSGLVNGLWLAFIGWFLNVAASASSRRVAVEHLLEDVPVSRLMRRQVRPVEPEVTVRELVDHWLLGTDERAFPVERGGVLAGLVSLEDVRGVPREAWETTTVGECMTPLARMATVPSDADAAEALRQFARRNVQQLAVLEGAHFAGLLRRSDLYRWIELHPAAG